MEIPRGNKPVYMALRDAGFSGAQPRRNIPWITVADNGTTIMNVWRRQLEKRGSQDLAIIDARNWDRPSRAEHKRKAVVEGLAALDGRSVRVVLLEERVPKSRRQTGARYDADAEWLVEDTGEEFLLWRARPPLESGAPVPTNPIAFGHLTPDRKEVVSRRIERDFRVRQLTLDRASNRCEIKGCGDAKDFATIDVHHITRLGDGGADHTDNTVALCPACHLRLHRGNLTVREKMEREVEKIRAARARSKSK